MQHLIP